jgi:hypothetical protein
MRAVLPLLLCCAALGKAQTTGEVRGKKVVEEAIDALGGDRFRNLRDRVEYGRGYSFYASRLSGLTKATISTRDLIPPDPPDNGFLGVRERQGFSNKKGQEDWYVIFNENGEGFEVTYRGAKKLPADTLKRWRDGVMHNAFYIMRMRLREPGMIVESRGADVADNQPVEIVDFTDSDNRVTRVYFQRSTKLPVKQEYVRRDQGDRFEEVTIWSKYREVDGIMWPFVTRRERDGEKIFEMFDESVEFNKDLTDDKFTIPANVPILDEKTQAKEK